MPLRKRELGAAVALVAAVDFALFHHGQLGIGGYSAAIFFTLVPAVLFGAARTRRLTFRLAAILGMFGLVAARCVFAPTPGTIALGVAMIFALVVALRARTSFVTDLAAAFGGTFITIPQRLEAAIAGTKKHFGSRDGGRNLPAIIVPLVLVALFVGIFGLANPLVGKWLQNAFAYVTVPSWARVIAWAAALFCALLLVRPAVVRSKATEDADPTTEMSKSSLLIARNALIPLNLVFFVNNALDAAYLWAGSAPPGLGSQGEGLHTAEQVYAHQGVAWLTVALLLLTLVVGVMFRGALAHDPRAKLARVLAYVWLGQGLVLALGTFRRMSIHIGTSGLSNIRFLGITGIILVVAGLVLVGIKLFARKSFVWLLRRQLDALALGAFGFCLFPTHLVAARTNVGRVMVKDYQALVHIEEQAASAESAAALLPILDHEDERIRRGMAALLLNERDALRKEAKLDTSWRDRDVATTRTLRALEAATPRLEAVLGDVERADAIVPFEYIRNSSIEGEIAQSEINKVKYALTRRQKVADRWATAHGSKLNAGAMLDDVYARDGIIVVDGKDYSRADVILAKTAFVQRLPVEGAEVVGPIEVHELPPLGDIERAEAKLTLQRGGPNGAKMDAVLLLQRQNEGEWRIASERGVGSMHFYD